MISRNSLVMFILAVVMVAYLFFAMMITTEAASRETLRKGMDVAVADTMMTRFITAGDIIAESGLNPDSLDCLLRSEFPLHELESRLAASDKIQDVNAWIAADGTLHLDVVPMTPVARVFEKGRQSYYINSQGKRISADPRYHLDVPVVVGSFSTRYPAQRLLPLLDHIARNPELSALVSTLRQEPNGNITIVPTIVGHVINFGDTSNVDDKFARLHAFYRKVVPARGWEMYDTISVKWDGRVVATKRRDRLAPTALATVLSQSDTIFEEYVDIETVTDPLTVAEGLTDGQKILPGL